MKAQKVLSIVIAVIVGGVIGALITSSTCKKEESRATLYPSKIVYTTDENVMDDYRFPTHDNLLIMDRAYAEGCESILVRIAPQKFTHRHAHNDTEQLYYVLSGEGKVVLERPDGSVEEHVIVPTNFVHIPRNNFHQIFCTGEDSLKYVAIDCFTFGHNADEPTWDSHARVVCDDNGYKYEDVRKR